MQADGIAFEREALRRVPELLAELLEDQGLVLDAQHTAPDRRADFAVVDSHSRRFLVDVKAFSRPGVVAQVARRLHALADDEVSAGETIPLLVVPYMSPASAQAAAEAGINWLDLSGNASIRARDLFVQVQGRPNAYRSRGRPSSPFAPRSSRVTRLLLLDPARWWRQRDLAAETGLDDGTISRTTRRLMDEQLLDLRGTELRPRDPGLLLDAWAEMYRPDRHDLVTGHVSGGGMEGAREIADRLKANGTHHAFTGLPAAWTLDRFAAFRLITVYVEEDPHEVAEDIQLRRETRGANVHLIGPNDVGVFAGERAVDGLPCVATVQVYLDLLHLPERASEAADRLRTEHLWARGN